MSLTSKLFSTSRRLVLGVSLAAAALAGCGGGTEPKETGSLSVTASATPSSLLEGDSLYAGAIGSAREGAILSNVSVFAAGQQANGSSSATLKVVPTTSGSVNATASGTRSQGAAASASAVAVPYTVTPLVATGTPSANTGVAGQSITFPYTAPVGTDSAGVVASDGRRFVTAGNTGSAIIPLLTAGNLTLTPYARNNTITRNGTPAIVNVTAAPVSLRIISKPLAGGTLGRYLANVGGAIMELPADTTISRQVGTYAVGVATADTLTHHFGEMIVGADTMPIAANYRAHNITLDGNKTIVLNLLTKNNPNFTSTDVAQFNMIWRDNFAGQNFLHPTKIKDWEVWFMENPTGIYTSSCATMTQADKDGALAAIDIMRTEDAAGPDGARRTFTYRAGDPVAAGKLIPFNGGVRPVSGVVLLCRNVTGPSNGSYYDAQGFFDSYWSFAGGSANSWMSEVKDFVDMVYSGQEGTRFDLSRNTNVDGLTRGPLDTFSYSTPMRIAFQAGQKGFGLIKGPQ